MTHSQPLTLDQVDIHFSAWRKKRKKRTRIPEQLWNEATSLYPVYPIANIVKRLRLCRTDFTQKLPQSANQITPEEQNDFVQVDFAKDSIDMQPAYENKLIVELEKGDGSRLRIQQSIGEQTLRSIINCYLRG
ncbi:MAG: hypothetical protein H8D23_38510 [Candidatus Brocadiales bacterium]|nr:hypothetical protein [Candidatus Brocadiales bacterium]